MQQKVPALGLKATWGSVEWHMKGASLVRQRRQAMRAWCRRKVAAGKQASAADVARSDVCRGAP